MTFRPRHERHGRREVWACSKQSHKGCRGSRSLTDRSKEAGGGHKYRRDRRIDAHGSAIGRPVKMRTVVNIVYQFEQCFCLLCTITVPPLADQWRPLSDHCGDHRASIRRPRQPLGHHGKGSTSTLLPLCDLLCHYSSFGGSRKAKSRAAVVTQKQNFLSFGDHWASLYFFWSLKGGTKVAALCKGVFRKWTFDRGVRCGAVRLTEWHTDTVMRS